MPDPFIVMTGVIAAAACVVCYRWGKKNGKQAGYFDGRYAGWRDCEDMVIKRMTEQGYDINKILEDYFQ